ncbi:MAG: linear amide C-N hydrolase [Theionarchaea archaeon]|nr:linear amide C-N hydrolase [Theionarchaea archaeon]
MTRITAMLWIFIFVIVVDYAGMGLDFLDITPESCTVFTASMGDTVLFGNNEDVGDKRATVWFVRATEDTYGWVYFGFRNYPILRGHFPMGGMNDQGLCFDITSIPECKMSPYPGKLPVVNGGVFGETVLKNCKNVEEAAQFIEQYDLSSFGDMQFLFADRTGNAMVLCPGTDGTMKVIKKAGVYQITTNFNLLQRNLGYPCWRYNTAEGMLAEVKSEDDLTVEYFLEILKATCNQGTTYTTIYDPVHGIAYFYNKQNFDDVAVFDLKDELEKGNHSYDAATLFSMRISEESEESESPSEIKESEEPEPFSTVSSPGLLSSLLYVILALVLSMVGVFVYKKVKKREKRSTE